MRRAVITAIVLAAPRAALACPVCFGQSDSPLAGAMNTGILFMLGFIAAVLVGFAAFIVHLNRRARLAADGERRMAPAPTSLTVTPQEGTAQC